MEYSPQKKTAEQDRLSTICRPVRRLSEKGAANLKYSTKGGCVSSENADFEATFRECKLSLK